MQGVVYELLNERSEPMSLVLKTIPHGRVSAVTGFLPSMEREWAIGHRLALYCTTPSGGALPRPPLCTAQTTFPLSRAHTVVCRLPYCLIYMHNSTTSVVAQICTRDS